MGRDECLVFLTQSVQELTDIVTNKLIYVS